MCVFENKRAQSLALSCGFGEITNSGFLANNYAQAAWHPLSVSDSAWDSLSPAAVADAQQAGPGWTPTPAEASGLQTSLLLGQRAGGCVGRGNVQGRLAPAGSIALDGLALGGCDLFSLVLHWHQATQGFLWPKELPAWENVSGKGDVLPVLGLSTS